MPTIGVQHCYRDLENSINSAFDLLAECETYKMLSRAGNQISIGSRRRELFASIALLRMHLAWEDFVERTFLRYLCGARSMSGFTPTLVRGTPCSTIHNALTTLLAGQQFITWSPTRIEILARNNFVSGEPFVTAISGSRNKLTEISNIRNRFAHRSEYASSQFETIVRAVLGYMPRGINPGRFLLMNDPAAPGHRFIDNYASILLVTARSIV